jgi:AP-4 complex subunit beta-1
MLITSIKLFFKRPPEMQRQLGRLFKYILENDKEDIDLKDRASFYYHSLQKNPQILCQIVNQVL